MNNEYVKEYLRAYRENIPELYAKGKGNNDELFKWKATKTFQDVWFDSDGYPDFISRFTAATKDCDVMLSTQFSHPIQGIEKFYEVEPQTVEKLFAETLFAPDGGDLYQRHEHMKTFVEQMNDLWERYYPQFPSYKQNRHTASVYLALYAPEDNYIFKYEVAKSMAEHSEFGYVIGAGDKFSLPLYYKMCDELREQILQDKELLDSHDSYLDMDEYYTDPQRHLLTFNVIYCCKKYPGLYPDNIVPLTPAELMKNQTEQEHLRQVIEENNKKYREYQVQLNTLYQQLPDLSDISLTGVEVETDSYGKGIIKAQDQNRIRVRFDSIEIEYILDKKYPNRPVFENDSEIVETLSKYSEISGKIHKIRYAMENGF